MSRIEGPQDVKLEACPYCIDEQMVKVASGLGALVCPGCDFVERPGPVRLADDLDTYRTDL